MKTKLTLFYFILLSMSAHQIRAKQISQVLSNNFKNQQKSYLNADPKNIFFEENKGQVKDQYSQPRHDVLFYGQSEGMSFHIRNNGISYQLMRVDGLRTKKSSKPHQKMIDINDIEPHQITTYRVDVNWLNVNVQEPLVQGAQNGYNNYYNVANGVAPALYVKQYTSVCFKNLWKGIDMLFYSRDGYLESDWIVHRGEDYKQIAFEVNGAELSIRNGSLVMKTALGEIVEGALKVEQNGKIINSRWILNGNHVHLEIESFDPNKPIYIDPPVRLWGTYYGGELEYTGSNCTVDTNDNVYLIGNTGSISAIATTGTHQTTHQGSIDAYMVKFDKSGVRQWATYYGSYNWDLAVDCAVDGSGNVYLAGQTNSINKIATDGAHQTNMNGMLDAFLVKFNSEGVRQWGTYYGGVHEDCGLACSVTHLGDLYLVGRTYSGSGIATDAAHQTTHHGGSDGFLVKFSTDGVRQWGTFYGGSYHDEITSCNLDNMGNIYVAGITESFDSIATADAHQPIISYGNSLMDAFIVKFNSNGVRQWGTYFGGLDDDYSYSCATDKFGNVFISGLTMSIESIATVGSHQDNYGGGLFDAFLAKFNSLGQLLWSTYYGGDKFDAGYHCATDQHGNSYLCGETKSNTQITTAGSFKITKKDDIDAFLVKFDSAGNRIWGTYYGGNNYEWGNMCTVDRNGNVYMVGGTMSNEGIASRGAHQNFLIGEGNNFLVKFDSESSWQNRLLLFPNPNNGNFTIQTESNKIFELYDISGSLIKTYNVNMNEYVINDGLESGAYFIREKETGICAKFFVIKSKY